jgi:hypothetical protein
LQNADLALEDAKMGFLRGSAAVVFIAPSRAAALDSFDLKQNRFRTDVYKNTMGPPYPGAVIAVHEDGRVTAGAYRGFANPKVASLLRPVGWADAAKNFLSVKEIALPPTNEWDTTTRTEPMELKRGDHIKMQRAEPGEPRIDQIFWVPDAWFDYAEALGSLKGNVPAPFVPAMYFGQVIRLDPVAAKNYYDGLDGAGKDEHMRLYTEEILEFDPNRALNVLVEKSRPSFISPHANRSRSSINIRQDWQELSPKQQQTLLDLARSRAEGWQGDSTALQRLVEAGITW